MGDMKTCKQCGKERALIEFPLDRQRLDGRHRLCKGCKLELDRAYRSANRERLSALSRARYVPNSRTKQQWVWALNHYYGITESEWFEILKSQNDCCAICYCDAPGGQGRWHVDHDHTTGQVRGLLCHGCNVGLGHFRDNPENLQRAIEYLREKV